jgi:hypothetical protein
VKSQALIVAVPRSVGICAVPKRTPVMLSGVTRAQSWLCICVAACDIAKKASDAEIGEYVALEPFGHVATAFAGS